MSCKHMIIRFVYKAHNIMGKICTTWHCPITIFQVFRNSKHVLYISEDQNYHICRAVTASLLCCIIYPPQLAKMQYTMTHTAHDSKVKFIQCGAHTIYSNRCHSNTTFSVACQSFKGKKMQRMLIFACLFPFPLHVVSSKLYFQGKMDGPTSKISVWKHGSQCANSELMAF